MARDFFNIEKGLGVAEENGDILIRLLSGTAAPDGLGDQAASPIGSLYARSGTGELYQKQTNVGNSTDWVLFQSGSGIVSRWRSEKVSLTTGDTLAAGSFDVTTLSDLQSTGTAVDVPVGSYIADGSGNLWEITDNASFPTITIAAAAVAPVEGDAFITDKYLPDSPADQENQAGILFTGGVFIKLFDVDWGRADSIYLTSSFSPINGDPMQGDSVELAIEKNTGNAEDLQTTVGVAQGSISMGTYAGSLLNDNETAKQNIQQLEIAIESNDQDIADLVSLSGRPANSTDLGASSVNGDIVSDNATIKQAIDELDDAITQDRGKSSALGITIAAPVDSVLVDEVAGCQWHIVIENAATPSNKKRLILDAFHDGTTSADATSTDDDVSSSKRLGPNFNSSVSVDLSGAAGSQVMRLLVASTEPSGVNVYAKRIETLF